MKQIKKKLWSFQEAYCSAPEILVNKGSHDDLSAAADIWSAGVILYILICGFPPFKARSHDELVQKIMTSPVNFGS